MKSLILILAMTILCSCGFHITDPGSRGVKVTLGKVSPDLMLEGFNLKWPWPIASIEDVVIKQQTFDINADCYSSDLQQIKAHVQVMIRIPQENVISLYKDYGGNWVDSLVAPRVQEAFKEVTATRSAEQIVKEREIIKKKAFDFAKTKIGGVLVIEDLVISNLTLTDQLEKAIEEKMVQEQQANKAKFIKQQAQVDAETAQIRAQGEANAIRTKAAALRENKDMLDLMVIEKWDGSAPTTLVMGQGGKGFPFFLGQSATQLPKVTEK